MPLAITTPLIRIHTNLYCSFTYKDSVLNTWTSRSTVRNHLSQTFKSSLLFNEFFVFSHSYTPITQRQAFVLQLREDGDLSPKHIGEFTYMYYLRFCIHFVNFYWCMPMFIIRINGTNNIKSPCLALSKIKPSFAYICRPHSSKICQCFRNTDQLKTSRYIFILFISVH
jgi:hypothetical protein